MLTGTLDAVPHRAKAMLEESIIPSPHGIELRRTPLSDFEQRQASSRPHVAELYHENSKLTPFSTMQPVGDGETLEQVRSWFFETSYDLNEEEFLRHESRLLRIRESDLPRPLQSLVGPFGEPGNTTNLLYSADLLVLHDNLLTRRVPQSPFLWTEREVAPEQVRRLAGGIAPGLEEPSALLFLVACPWRYMFLYGPRGYRHTLLDIGRLLAFFERIAAEQELALSVYQNFHDAAIDRFVLADGVERSVYAVMALRT